MFRNTPSVAASTLKIAVGLGLCTLGGAMLYVYFKNRDDEDEKPETKKEDAKKEISEKSKKQKEVCIKLVFSVEHIPLIVGRGGANLTAIEEKTCTKIRLRDKDERHTYCDVTGTPNAVKDARTMLMKEIERSPIVKEEIFVPQSVCGKIMGRCGEAMQEICRVSLAKVAVDEGGRSTGAMDRKRIIIIGNRQQVNIARKLIDDKIEEDEELRRSLEEVEQHREPRRSPTNSIDNSLYSSQNSLSSISPREKLINANINDKPMEVFVSAVASPSKFWVQIVGAQSKKLDDLVEAMTQYYDDNRSRHKITEPYLGQIVAAVFKYDGKWYRAEIVGILPNNYNPSDVVLDLFFVDYGDSEYVGANEVFELRTDFLTLRFQAVECFLANVKTMNANGLTWDSPAIEKFEELTQVANWKKLTSRVVTYKERPKICDETELNSAVREGSPIPGIELYENIEGGELNIGLVLIAQGFALPIEDDGNSSSYETVVGAETELINENPIAPSLDSLKQPISSSYENGAEDALIEQQLQHLQDNQNLSVKDNASAVVSPAKFSTEYTNGNLTTLNGEREMNGNLSR